MPDTLKNVVSFAAVAVGAQVTMAHGLASAGVALKPDEVKLGSTSFEYVSSTATTVTVKNNGLAAASCDVLCEAWHPIERQFGTLPDDGSFHEHLTPQPFIQGASPAPGVHQASIVYGSGQDGAPNFNGVNTFAYAIKVGSVYTLTRDVFIADGSIIRSGATVFTSGFRGFCNGKCTIEAGGILENDGKNAAANVAGGTSAVGTTGVGTPGGAGRVGVGAGTNGSNQQGVNTVSDASPAGGAGGAGGAQAGGVGGTYATSSTNGGANFLTPMQTGYLFTQQSGGNSASINPIGGGSGGGGGGSDNAGVSGGGGGGGGGVLIWNCYELENNGVIRVRGGNGGDATGAGGNGGGGGGGGGGIVQILAATRYGSGAYDVSGGTGGAKIGAGGVAGVNGNNGHTNLFYFPF